MPVHSILATGHGYNIKCVFIDFACYDRLIPPLYISAPAQVYFLSMPCSPCFCMYLLLFRAQLAENGFWLQRCSKFTPHKCF